MNRGASWAIGHRVTESETVEATERACMRLCTHTHTHTHTGTSECVCVLRNW